MNKTYSEKFCLRTSDFDCRARLKPSAILDLFQEVAGSHASELGVGFEELLKNNLLWVLTKVKFKIVGKIDMHKAVIVKTWPLAPSRVTLQRDYLIEDENGNPIVIGTSEWVTMHSETRRLVPKTDIYPLEEFCQDKMFEEKLRKVPDFEIGEDYKKIIPEFCDLDVNSHVNNIRYADYVMNFLNPQENEDIEEFQLDFHREIHNGMPISLYLEKNEDALAKGISEDGEKMFSCAIKFKNT